MLLEGKTALITGASRGIGKAIALGLAREGCKIAVNYRQNNKAANNTVADIVNAGSQAMPVPADVTIEQQVKNMIDLINDAWGKIDILVNNAGIVNNQLIMRMTEKAWDDTIDTSLKGAFLCTRHVLRKMTEQNWGRVINISSVAAQRGNYGQCNYSAAKAGLVAFTRSVAREVGKYNITVNAIAPGLIQTDMMDTVPEAYRKEVLGRLAVPRFGTPEDVANLAVFLASERSAYITAQVVNVDGGYI
ncbi:MAG: 3-oxoacyl-ACP reductase FabG [Dehalococcoidales bacterium]|jgi:3-oxoacyl-[acyl-carrier protein] reductase|nr:3-oxoacyl-ACP reductase FabG [Dehalococcoidales bacterium]MDD4466086.1 3-oxoacyl-ACP reductase FabG [Dehalococcoidales bacterium]